jgi:hypothetical protein
MHDGSHASLDDARSYVEAVGDLTPAVHSAAAS